ncbi:hypothetical protein NIES2135_48010 [Leptolyngbya boryana NIES-2135]|jgi:hypothetical protein|uniref:Uncharacterized protein n=1 Tax=Leptolyngbya boryana NIES-2135 TaxID=1973484 RepID=A0A1Z4JMQ1_LEPBY|nr:MULTISPECIES: hypothetical protein [Leptolyngbya]BAY57928.1 hypothetical protein NIES2135_48010 [Leptolyngbya boryana NIES-2135]MBD2367373.1 hypothetical protein [Leptolyngbya sp. FACHB-161]MBD2373897.1 hypothetical protein [Leptolyngbya sp. FACHB-238]MBD2398303.1 hypothetical protein [Leptolyngbya sp. FACHB-239]MBD2404200.1 hypothetical protein [Leptolyngbya sp. FACHB-402]
MAHLIYPHLCLFSYVLRDETQDSDERESFQKDLIAGTVYRYGRGDTEQYLITSAIEKQESQSLDNLKLLKEIVLAKTGSCDRELGRSWLVFGVLPEGEDPQNIVRSSCEILGIENLSDSADQWQGAKIFECGLENQHGIVALYSSLDEMKAIAGEALQEWLYLLQFRHKVNWAYGNTRQIKPLLSQHLFPKPSSIMSLTMQDVEVSELDLQNLTQDLKQNLTLLSQYTECLSFLEFQLETVKTNLENYRSRLSSMSAKGSHSFQKLSQFEQIGSRDVRQIERDIATLTIGLRVREKTTDTIRGLVELEQAERDRRLEAQSQKFQDSIAVLGVGVGSVAITASFAAAKLEDASIVQSVVKVVPAPMRVSPWTEGAIGVLMCSAIGILFAVLIRVWLFFGKGRKSR